MIDYYIVANKDDKTTGPYTVTQLAALVKTKEIHKNSLIWYEEQGDDVKAVWWADDPGDWPSFPNDRRRR